MSDYPPAPPYSASYGSQAQPNPSYLPTYPNQYMQQDNGRTAQTHIASNYDTSMSAYGYNNSLPGFNAGPLASAAPPLPIYQGWNQDAIPLPSYSTPHGNMQYTGYGGNSYQPPQPYSAPQPQTYHQSTPNAPYDEGELSEGEFDAYAGQNGGGITSAIYGSGYYHGSDGTGYMNTAHRAVYPGGQDYSNQQQYSSGNEYNSYPRESASYSPYAPAPVEAPQDRRSKGKQSYNALAERPVNSTPSWAQSHTVPESLPGVPASQAQPLNPVERSPLPAKPVSPAPFQSVNREVSKPLAESSSPAHQAFVQDEQRVSGFKSVAEARKKAEAAILNMWARDVRYPVYIEEGLDEEIVGRLFDSLGLSRAPSKAAIPIVDDKSMIDNVNGTRPRQENIASLSSANSLGGPSNLEAFKVGDTKAQLLIQQNGNPAPLNPRFTTPNKPPEPTEKEKNLKMKMDMLRKSREERAQKAAAKIATSNVTSPTVPTATDAQPEEAPKPATSTTVTRRNSLVSSPLPAIPDSIPPKPTAYPLNTQPVPPLQPQTPAIPGLFLASTSSPVLSTSAQSKLHGAPQNSHRKRPVAADFDTPSSTMLYKRPFGQSRNDSLVIDVSEDELDSEDEDVAMDLESQADQDSPVQAVSKMSEQRTTAIQNLPPLTNFPIRKQFNSPPGSSAASTPPIHLGSKSALGHPHVLQQKETEIEALKKKIAAAEAAKAAKRKAQTSSGTATPISHHQATNGFGVNSSSSDFASKVETSIQMQQLIGMTENRVSSDQKRLAEARAVALEKATELKRNEAESRRLRREKIATDLPRVDAEVEQKQLKLQQLREEMAEIEATIQRDLEGKRILAEEMERLGQETEDQLQEQKDKLKDLTENASNSGSPQQASLPTAHFFTEQEKLALPSRPMSNSSTSSLKASSPTVPITTGREETMSSFKPSSPATNGVLGRPSPVGKTDVYVTSNQATEAALHDTIRADANFYGGEDEIEIDMEDTYAPDPTQLAPEWPNKAPGLPNVTAIRESQVSVGDHGLLDQLQNSQQLSTFGNEDDDYEPPEATPPEGEVESPAFSPAPPESVPDVEEFTYDVPASGHLAQENHSAGESDLGKQVNSSVPHLIEGDTSKLNKIQSFTPYESPLKYFKAFRFHPNFKQEVVGGLKSVTYSNKINPNTDFCRYELAGGVCNDNTCESQHFRDIALTEDTILSILGSPEEFPAEQQPRFREGLREVLTGLRARKVRDFDTIAAEVVAHRSKFLGDPSKVLMLEGTTI